MPVLNNEFSYSKKSLGRPQSILTMVSEKKREGKVLIKHRAKA
jgi:hypothetical protein